MCRDCRHPRRCEKKRKPDIVLTSDLTGFTDEALVALPLKLETCEYVLSTLNGAFGASCTEITEPQLVTKKKHRQLKVTGSVTGGEVKITVQTGEETPRVFTFIAEGENTEVFELVEDLVKGDKITFQYASGPVDDATIKLKALIVKKY